MRYFTQCLFSALLVNCLFNFNFHWDSFYHIFEVNSQLLQGSSHLVREISSSLQPIAGEVIKGEGFKTKPKHLVEQRWQSRQNPALNHKSHWLSLYTQSSRIAAHLGVCICVQRCRTHWSAKHIFKGVSAVTVITHICKHQHSSPKSPAGIIKSYLSFPQIN